MKNKRQSVALFAVVLVVLLTVIIMRAPERETSGKTSTSPVFTAKDLSADFFNALTLLQHDGKLYAAKRTGSLGEGVREQDLFMTPDLAATYAWAILGSLTSLADDRERSLLTSEALFKRWTSLANTEDEMYALWQLYVASTLSSEESVKKRYYGWFWGRVKLQLRNHARAMKTHRYAKAEPMLLATLARQFLLAAQSLKDKTYVEYLLQSEQIYHEAAASSLAKEYIEAAEQMIDALKGRVSAPEKATPYLVGSVEFPQYSCWTIWAEHGRYLAREDEALRVKIIHDLKKIGIGEREFGQFRFNTLQSLLPCTDVMLQIGDDELKQRAKRAFEQFIVSAWDSVAHNVCSGTGGFLATPIGSHDLVNICAGNTRFLSDSAWIAFQLVFFEGATEFRDLTTTN